MKYTYHITSQGGEGWRSDKSIGQELRNKVKQAKQVKTRNFRNPISPGTAENTTNTHTHTQKSVCVVSPAVVAVSLVAAGVQVDLEGALAAAAAVVVHPPRREGRARRHGAGGLHVLHVGLLGHHHHGVGAVLGGGQGDVEGVGAAPYGVVLGKHDLDGVLARRRVSGDLFFLC